MRTKLKIIGGVTAAQAAAIGTISDKADKVDGATENNLPAFDNEGNLTDSGKGKNEMAMNPTIKNYIATGETTAVQLTAIGDLVVVTLNVATTITIAGTGMQFEKVLLKLQQPAEGGIDFRILNLSELWNNENIYGPQAGDSFLLLELTTFDGWASVTLVKDRTNELWAL